MVTAPEPKVETISDPSKLYLRLAIASLLPALLGVTAEYYGELNDYATEIGVGATVLGLFGLVTYIAYSGTIKKTERVTTYKVTEKVVQVVEIDEVKERTV